MINEQNWADKTHAELVDIIMGLAGRIERLGREVGDCSRLDLPEEDPNARDKQVYDFFAGCALEGTLAAERENHHVYRKPNESYVEAIARFSFDLTDAMMEERKRRYAQRYGRPTPLTSIGS